MNIYALVCLVFLSAWNAWASEDFYQRVEKDTFVNWSKGELTTTGKSILTGDKWTMDGKLNAHRAAQLDGFRKLVSGLNQIQISATSKVSDYASHDGQLAKKIEGMVHHFQEKAVRFLDEGICEVDMVVPIRGDGSISEIFLEYDDIPLVSEFKMPEMVSAPEKDTPKTHADADQATAIEDVVTKSSDVKDLTQTVSVPKVRDFSGLIVDVGGKDLVPALSPKVVDENGNVVYDISTADRAFRKQNGLASYAVDLSDARLDQRVTENPYVLKAVKLKEDEPTTVIVKSEDAKAFLETDESDRILKRCRVIFVSAGDPLLDE